MCKLQLGLARAVEMMQYNIDDPPAAIRLTDHGHRQEPASCSEH